MSDRELTDVREMRKAITEMGRSGNSFFAGRNEYSMAAVLARHCRDVAHHQGLSGEDAMTLLAYHALMRLDKANEALLMNARCSVGRLFMPAAAEIGKSGSAASGQGGL